MKDILLPLSILILSISITYSTFKYMEFSRYELLAPSRASAYSFIIFDRKTGEYLISSVNPNQKHRIIDDFAYRELSLSPVAQRVYNDFSKELDKEVGDLSGDK